MRTAAFPTPLFLGQCLAIALAALVVNPLSHAADSITPGKARVELKHSRNDAAPARVPVGVSTNRPIFAPSQPQTITPGGTFSRPATTFSPQTGSFSRPASTFSHPGSSYTPLPPIQVPVHNPTNRPPHRPRPPVVPQGTYVEPMVIYETQTSIEEAPAVTTQAPAEIAPAQVEAPIVLDLPPGATIRRAPVQAPAKEPTPK